MTGPRLVAGVIAGERGKLMRKVIACSLLLAVAVGFVGCASPFPMGSGFIELKLPLQVTSNASVASPKVGIAECKSFCGVVAMGDASLSAAMKQGGITKVHYVDWQVKNIAGIIGQYRLIVYGE